jgi:hypothetical protein
MSADGVSTDSAAITSLPRPKIGAATDVIGDGAGREATATPSRRTAASVARSSDGDSRRFSGTSVRSPASAWFWTSVLALASRHSPTPVACSGIRPPTR